MATMVDSMSYLQGGSKAVSVCKTCPEVISIEVKHNDGNMKGVSAGRYEYGLIQPWLKEECPVAYDFVLKYLQSGVQTSGLGDVQAPWHVPHHMDFQTGLHKMSKSGEEAFSLIQLSDHGCFK
ncbi:hypothetical protein llap_14590 [Limosa lapponica baueri]|uniref:Uncharacterized protein n=1 Tax=Limosa lapponica baueri TaxID=1758121 RepID=A0A2I0TMR7_LIMLA|nr:hypothetical protein llap_14590 [Limosa lapponica baueri]